MTLPSSLLAAISSRGGGKVALILGAGCSFESPTQLPLAGKCSEEAHRKLVADGLIESGECTEPWDLSALADLVKRKSKGSQRELVSRLPTREFRNATPNIGHKIAAVLMLEGAISSVVTLNFDLALSHAVSAMGARSEISIINGPDQHGQLGKSNVVYLHRSIEADPDELILTTEALEEAWVDGWEQWVAQWAMSAPVTVFAGLGSSCGVLRHTATKLRAALGPNVQLLLANPGDPKHSHFASEMDIDGEDYVMLGWTDFMRELGSRFHVEVIAQVRQSCEELSLREGWTEEKSRRPLEDLDSLVDAVSEFDLLAFGRLRAAWLLNELPYPKLESSHLNSIADLLLGVAYAARQCGITYRLHGDGHAEFAVANRPPVRVRLIDGSAHNYRWLTIESRLRDLDRQKLIGAQNGGRVLACGVSGRKPNYATPPESIVDGEDDSGDIVSGGTGYSYWDVEELREDKAYVDDILA